MKTLLKVVLLAVAFTTLPAIARADCPFPAFEIISGSGSTFLSACITDRGNVIQFETPQGVKDIFQSVSFVPSEGYGICDLVNMPRGIAYYDYFTPSALFPTTDPVSIIKQPNGLGTFPLTITRTSDDGVWTLVQTFSRQDVYPPSLQIKMTLKNNTNTARYVNFLRHVTPSHGWDSFAYTVDSALAYNLGIPGFLIQAPTPLPQLFAVRGRLNGPDPCNPLPLSDIPPLNFVGSISLLTVTSQNVPAHKSIGLSILYKRM
jgi:hypothetical protein